MTRILAFDTSLSRPGVALIEIKRNQARVIDMSNVKTDAKQNHAIRAKQVESWALLFVGKHIAKGFDVVVREDFQGRTSRQNHPVFAAWSACDRALNTYGLTFTTASISPSSVKKAVVGRGNAEKDEVANAAREWTGYSGEFGSDDESDAVAIALAFAIQNGLITK